uniref:Angiopoietin like 7 n=1 Tax=Pavo cristatus TaxID=9049 RepID=A0A8C9L813_PAVCR
MVLIQVDAVYDCSSLYQRNYRISGVYKLPPDEFLGSPDLEVFCDMETDGGGWTIIQRRKVGLTSFNRDWKQYREGFGNIRGDFWLGNENIYRLSRRPTVLRVELEDWEGNTRYAQYKQFTLSNELNSYRLFVGNYTGNTGRDSLRYHNNTAFSTKDKDNDKCVDDCAQFRKGGYWYNCCTDSNLNGVYYRKGEHTKNMDGITWYGWHGSTYSLKRVEMKIRPEDFKP